MASARLVALVTDFSSKIGAAIANRLAISGYTVYGGCIESGEAAYATFERLDLDITDEDSVENAITELIKLEARIDLLVNTAELKLMPAGAEESSIEQAKALFDINFFSMVRMIRAVVPVMRTQRYGRIVNLGPALSGVPLPYFVNYSASKYAVKGYSHALDHELRNHGIRVSVVEPGFIKTLLDDSCVEPDFRLLAYEHVESILANRLHPALQHADAPDVVARAVVRAATSKRPKLRYTAGSTSGRLSLLRALNSEAHVRTDGEECLRQVSGGRSLDRLH